MSKNSSISSGTPALGATQFGSSNPGSLSSAVNLFRGDVNYQLPLVQLDAMGTNSDLQVQVALLLESNVSQAVQQWNLEQPTGTLGVGWSLPVEQITSNRDGAFSSSATSYSYQGSGSSNALIPVAVSWIRAQLDPTTVGTLAPGPVSSSLIAAFQAAGLALSSKATLGGEGPWTVQDDVHEHIYELSLVGSPQSLQVVDGGRLFQLQNDQPWKVAYYQDYERWEITDDTGTIKVFGGGKRAVLDYPDYLTSDGNSVQWGVKWGGDSGNWAGSSNDVSQQTQYAETWNLSTQVDRWGNRVLYQYNLFERQNGLLGNGAEQLVGTGGLPYTKACYPSRIIDPYGRSVSFEYGNKTYTVDAQEFVDPHKVLTPASAPNTLPQGIDEPNAYQDCYETQLLTGITVRATNGSVMHRYGFTYLPPTDVTLQPAASDGAPAPQGPLAAALCKSYLAAVTPYDSAGTAQAGYRFDYYWAGEGPNLGAVKSITFPQGGGGRFTYADEELAICAREQALNAPESLGDNAVPHIFYGPDYAVSAWTNSANTEMTLAVHTWVGRWQRWAPGKTLYSGNAFDPSSLQFFATENTFALALTVDGATRVYLFNRDPHRQAFWQALDNGGQSYVSLQSADAADLTAGNRFFVAVTSQDGADGTTWSLYRYHYDWVSDQWQGLDGPVISGGTDQLCVLAQNEYVLTMSLNALSNDGSLSISYLDELGNWHDPTPELSFSGINLNQNGGRMVWAADASMAAFTIAESPPPAGSITGSYEIFAVRWDTSYALSKAFSATCTADVADSSSLQWPPRPSMHDNSLIGTGAEVWRYIGTEWIHDTFSQTTAGSLNWLAYSYGSDVGIQAANEIGTTVDSQLLVFDPDSATFSQVSVPSESGITGSTAGFPHAGSEDFIIANNAIFYRGAAALNGAVDWGWSQAVQLAIGQVPAGANSVALVDQAPNYLAWLEPDGDSEEVELAVLENGLVRETSTLPQIFNASALTDPTPGSSPAGPDTLALYSADGSGLFSQAQSFSILRFAGNDIQGTIRDFPVVSMEVWNGYGENQWTTYRYETSTAACDSSGRTVKYFRSTVYEGCRGLRSASSGRKENIYLNDLFASGYSMLDGQQLQQISFEGATLDAVSFGSGYGLDPAGPTNGTPVNISQTPDLAPLVELFSTLPTPPLSDQATLQYVQVEVAEATAECDYELLPAQWAQDCVGYRFWWIEDPGTGLTYNLDYNLDPTDPEGLTIYLGRPVQSQSSTWALYTGRAGNPQDNDGSVMPLHGGFARNVASAEINDGVPSLTRFSYVPSGLPAPFYNGVCAESWTTYGLDGEPIEWTQTTTYGAQVYSELYDANVLQPTAELLTQTCKNSGTTYQTAAQACDWRAFSRPDGVQILDLAGRWNYCGNTSQSATFPFGTNPSADDWLTDELIRARDVRGNITETTDSAGCARSVARDYATTGKGLVFLGQVPTLMTHNASLAGQEAAACGFESSEDLSAWSLTGGAEVVDDIAHTGEQSLYLPTGAEAKRATLTPDDNHRVYVVSCWYRYHATEGQASEVLSATVSLQGTTIGSPVELELREQSGAWAYAQGAVDLSRYHDIADSSEPLAVALSVSVAEAPELWIDDVRFSPLDGSLEMLIHDPVDRRPIALLNSTDGVSRLTYGADEKPACRTGKDDRIEVIESRYDSLGRSWTSYLTWLEAQQAPLPPEPAEYRFDPAAPNAQLSLKCRGGGRIVSGYDGDAWQELWQPAQADQWSTAGGALIHASADSSDTLTVQTAEQELSITDFAVYLELGQADDVDTPVSLQPGFELAAGSAVVAWTGTAWELTIGSGQPIQSPQPVSGSISSLLMIGTVDTCAVNTCAANTSSEDSVSVGASTVDSSSGETTDASGWFLCFQNGRLLFGEPVTATDLAGEITLTTGNNALAVEHLTLGHQPAIQWLLQDAGGQTRQSHLLSGDDYLVNQMVLDDAGRAVVKTKSIPGTYGQGADLPCLAYRPNLVDVERFRLSLEGSGVMQGDVADYYSVSDPTTGRTDDGGYPYSRRRLEASPLGRPLEVGEAGASRAIIGPITSSAAQRGTLQWLYGNNNTLSIPFSEAPAGQFAVTLRTAASGLSQTMVQDSKGERLGRSVAAAASLAQQATVLDFTSSGPKTTTYLPNSYTDLPDAAEQIVVTQYDPLMRVISQTTPDSGTTLTLYDDAGRRRFVQDAEGAAKGYFTFFLYDPTGRELVQGVVSGDWSTAQANANQPGWPLSTAVGSAAETSDGSTAEDTPTYIVQNRKHYDGDGSCPHSVGQITRAETENGASVVSGDGPFAEVRSHFEWDRSSNLSGWRTQTSWSDGQGQNGDFRMGFEHDNLGQLSAMTYPKSGDWPFERLHYTVNGLGQLTSIHDDHGNALAAWAYDAMGQAISGAAGSVMRGTKTYNSPGDLLSITDVGTPAGFSTSQTLESNDLLRNQSDTFTSGLDQSFELTFGYDGLNRLTSVTNSAFDDLSQGFSYTNAQGVEDLNGNIQTVTGCNAAGFTMQGNQLSSAQWQDGSSTTYGYLANGVMASRATTPSAPTDMPDLTLTIIEGGILPASVVLGDQTVQYAYDIKGNRVGKRILSSGVPSSTTLSVPGKARPFAQFTGTVGTAYVFSPQDLIAVAQGGALYPVAVDALGSVRAVLDDTGAAVAGGSYLAYGGQAGTAYDNGSPNCSLRFTGAELDPETGLYFMNARLYDPWIGRFTAPDPDQEYASPYVYVGGRPNQWVDPTGRLTQGEALLIDIGVGLVGVGLMLAAPETVPFLSWGAASAFTGAASSGFFNLLQSPQTWSTKGFVASMFFGGAMGFLTGGFSGGWIGKEEPITAKALRDVGWDESTGAFEGEPSSRTYPKLSSSEEGSVSTWKKTKAVGKEIYEQRLIKRRPAYVYGYAIQGLSLVVTNYSKGQNSSVYAAKTIGEYWLYPLGGLTMAYASTRFSSMGTAVWAIHGKSIPKKVKRWLQEGSGDDGEGISLLLGGADMLL